MKTDKLSPNLNTTNKNIIIQYTFLTLQVISECVLALKEKNIVCGAKVWLTFVI